MPMMRIIRTRLTSEVGIEPRILDSPTGVATHARIDPALSNPQGQPHSEPQQTHVLNFGGRTPAPHS